MKYKYRYSKFKNKRGEIKLYYIKNATERWFEHVKKRFNMKGW